MNLFAVCRNSCDSVLYNEFPLFIYNGDTHIVYSGVFRLTCIEYIRTHVHAYVHVCFDTPTYLYSSCVHAYVHTYLIHTYVHTSYIHMYIPHTYICTYLMHAYVHTSYIHMYIPHTYICTYLIHTYVHTSYMHMYIPHTYICTCSVLARIFSIAGGGGGHKSVIAVQ